MNDKLLTLCITLVVGVILAGSLLVPVLNNVTATEKTYTNNGYYRMSETESETVIVWDTVNTPTKITVNDTEIDLTTLGLAANKSYSIAFANDFILRYTSGELANMQVWQAGYAGGVSLSDAVTATFTMTTEGISLARSDSESVSSFSHSGEYFAIDPAGDYIMKDMSKNAYLLEDSSVIYAGGISNIVDNGPSGIYFAGTVDDITVTPMNSSTTVSNVASTYTEVSETVGVISLEKVTFTTTITVEGVDYVIDQSYTYFLVPYQVTAELSNHLTSGQISLMGAIPVMVIVALLMAAVGAIALRRND